MLTMSWTPVKAAEPNPLLDMCLRHCAACPNANSSGGWPRRCLDSEGAEKGVGQRDSNKYNKNPSLATAGKGVE